MVGFKFVKHLGPPTQRREAWEDAVDIFAPEGWARARGYSYVVAAEGRQVFVSGQIGWNPRTESFEAGDFVDEARQALTNLAEALGAAGARTDQITFMTWYLTDRNLYTSAARDIGKHYKEIIGSHYPAMTMVEVSALLSDQAHIEIDAVAVVPPSGG
jgi:enamine deaminase RidA (YjgF/YER057c/UK114 family)